MIEIECHCGVGLAGCAEPFTLTYEPCEIEGLSHEQIVDMAHRDALRVARHEHLEVWVTVPGDFR